MLVLCSLRLLRWLEAAFKLRSFLLDLPDLALQRPLPQLHLAYVRISVRIFIFCSSSSDTSICIPASTVSLMKTAFSRISLVVYITIITSRLYMYF